MNNNQGGVPAAYDNAGFQPEERRPPPYSPQNVYPVLPQETPSYVVSTPRASIINTQQTAAPVLPPPTVQRKASKKCQWKHVLCGCLCTALVLAVIGILLWYFLYYQCLLGKSCRTGGKCLSMSQWCDGVSDCQHGEDEAQCFRLHGTNFVLQTYSPSSEAWMPVCAERWDDNFGRSVCQQMGYTRQEYFSSSKVNAGSLASKGYMMLKPGSSYSSNIQSQLSHSLFCLSSAVQLRCIECGQSSAGPSSRIVGGTDAVDAAWPWQVSLQIDEQHICGGSIIGPSWILSAAHCFQRYNSPSIWRVYSGDVSKNSLSYTSGNAVDKIINHEGYDPETNDNDVALLKLSSPLTFSRTVKPVCLPNVGVNPAPGSKAWVTGWGALISDGPSPDRLQQAQVTVYSRETCNKDGVLNGQVSKTMICAGKLSGGVDTCQGDSGGPLVVKEGNVWWLAGDTSWGIGCAWKNKPGVYGNVSYFADWVYRQLKKN